MARKSEFSGADTSRSNRRRVVGPADIEAFRLTVLDWFASFGRDLPWRHTRDPYRILVSEIMLQQTQVVRVIPKYFEFLDIFPTVNSLSTASLAAVLRAWKGLGTTAGRCT